MAEKSIRHFITNIICGFIYSKAERRRLRVVLNSPILEYIKFIKQDTGIRRPRIKTFVGYQARSLIIGVNNKWIYKFPLRRDNYRELALREARVISALAPLSPIHVPSVDLIEYRGMLVRKYEFINGSTLRTAPRKKVMSNLVPLARQVANFIYEIGQSDPESIRDLKPSPNARPGYMHGWCQGDICDNFIIDMKTMRIRAFIDWEDCAFTDFHAAMHPGRQQPSHDFMPIVQREYDKIWRAHHGK